MNTIKIRNLKKAYLKPETHVHKISLNKHPKIQKPDFFNKDDTIEILRHSIPPLEFITTKTPLPPLTNKTTGKLLKNIQTNLIRTQRNKFLIRIAIHSAKKEKTGFQYPIYRDNLPRNRENIYQAIKKSFPMLERKHIFLSRYFPNFPASHVNQLHAENKNLCGTFIFDDKPMQTCALIIFIDGIKRRTHHLIIPNKIPE